jgi:hypothetical protein
MGRLSLLEKEPDPEYFGVNRGSWDWMELL